MSPKKLSVVLSVYNEEKNLKDCLESVKFADEIIIVDHESTDETVEIAKKYTIHIYSQKNDPANIDVQKNFGFAKATSEWILSLDADERVTPELAKEILEKISADETVNAFEIPRKNIIFGKWIEHSLWWPDYQRRLFRKGKGEYSKSKVHQNLEVSGTIAQLTQPLLHENYQTISQFLRKLDTYTESEATALFNEKKLLHWHDAIRMPIHDFLNTFFYRKGYMDGLHGLVLSLLQAFYAFIVFAKVWEKQGFKEENSANFLQNVFAEAKRAGNEIFYWFYTVFEEETKSPVKKNMYRLFRRSIKKKIS